MFHIKTRASLLAYGPLSGGFVIDRLLKILVLDDFGSIKVSNRLFGRILVKFWNLCKKKKNGTLTWMYVCKCLSDS